MGCVKLKRIQLTVNVESTGQLFKTTNFANYSQNQTTRLGIPKYVRQASEIPRKTRPMSSHNSLRALKKQATGRLELLCLKGTANIGKHGSRQFSCPLAYRNAAIRCNTSSGGTVRHNGNQRCHNDSCLKQSP